MTIEEIFKNLATHMIKGMMLHEELANYYDFLHLKGYKKCHEYHYLTESCGYRKLYHYYVQHYNKLIEKEHIDSEDIIPSSWYGHTREDVDTKLKRQSVEMGIQTWVNWEKQTKELYQHMFMELMNLGEIASALFLKHYILDVDEQLKCAEKKYLDAKAIDYDISVIIESQEKKYYKYKEKMKEFSIY